MSMITDNFDHYAKRQLRRQSRRNRLALGTPTVEQELQLAQAKPLPTEPFAPFPLTQFCWIRKRRYDLYYFV